MSREKTGSMQEVDRVLSRAGINRFTPAEISTISGNYHTALLDGLRGQGVLPMFQSHLHPVEINRIPLGKKALIVEVGGTNVYGAYVESVDGNMVISDEHRSPLPTRTYDSRKHFFGTIIEGLTPLLDSGKKPDALSIVYSFPGTAKKSGVGVDVDSVEELTKEFVVPGISQEPIGATLRRVGSERYPFFTDLPTVVLNDTVAVALATGSPVGGVVGTGFNLSVETSEGIVSTESGAFNKFPPSAAFDELDQNSRYPGAQTSEKRISGLYIPWYFTYGLKALNQEGLPVKQEVIEDAAVISEILSKEPRNEDEAIRVNLARAVAGQSAQIVGLMVGTLLDTFHHDHEGVIAVPVEGSTQWGLPGYVDTATETARLISGKEVVFQNVPAAGRRGAGVAALGTLLR